MEHVQPVDQSFSWRGVALALALVLVIALSVVGGVVLLGRITATHPAPRTSPASTKRPAIPLRPRSHISVLVLNGNGVTGAAGGEASQLLGKGYRKTDAADATTGYATSLVLFRPGWGREAKRLGRDAGIHTVAPLDGSLPSADAGYQLVVILGAGS